MGSRSKGIYCHMVSKNSRETVLGSRYMLVREAQTKGIRAASRQFQCSKNTAKGWLRRYESEGMAGLEDRRKGPNKIPHKLSREKEEHIIECRKEAPCYGPKRLRNFFNIEASEGAIARVIKENGLTRKNRKKYQRKQDLRKVKAAKYKALEHVQMDVKHLYDIPYYWTQMKRYKLPIYEYTLRDTKSGLIALGFAQEYSELYSTLMVECFFEHLKRCNHDPQKVTIQTDNGTEFGQRKRDINVPGFVNTIMCKYKAKHLYIPPGLSNANADVESLHSTIEKEFFDLESFKNTQDFWTKVQAYQLFYNIARPNYSKAGKTPAHILFEEHPNINANILLFPVIDLDRVFRMKYPDQKNFHRVGQPLQELPE